MFVVSPVHIYDWNSEHPKQTSQSSLGLDKDCCIVQKEQGKPAPWRKRSYLLSTHEILYSNYYSARERINLLVVGDALIATEVYFEDNNSKFSMETKKVQHCY